MKPILGSGRKTINIKCTQVAIPEFPDLLFGAHFDGSSLFDATKYLHIKSPDHTLTVEDFFDKFDFQIHAIAETYGLELDKLVTINVEGHQLIDGSLCFPFLSYVDPQFCAYTCSIMDELFSSGFVVSDTYLIQTTQKRLSPELLKQFWNNGTDKTSTKNSTDI